MASRALINLAWRSARAIGAAGVQNGYNYYGDTTTSLLVSRLTYKILWPILARFISAVMCRGARFVKGFIGGGGINSGQLLDEDFPPLTVPYSATTSDTNGTLSYGTIDVGYSLIRQPNIRLGPFSRDIGHWNKQSQQVGHANQQRCFQLPAGVAASFALVDGTRPVEPPPLRCYRRCNAR